MFHVKHLGTKNGNLAQVPVLFHVKHLGGLAVSHAFQLSARSVDVRAA